MKVLQINTVCGTGSTGRIAVDIHNSLEEKGFESYIAYGRGPLSENENFIKIGSNISNYTHAIKTRLLDEHGFGSKLSTLHFIRKLEKINPDIIHLHNIHGYYINIKILFNYLKKSKKPIVWTLHDCWSFTGHCAYFDFVKCDKWKTECYSCPAKKEYPKSFYIDNSRQNFKEKNIIFNSVDDMTLVTPSQWLASLTRKSFLNKYDVKVINNGINLNVFKPTNQKFREIHNLNDKFIILGVANLWDKRKGLNYFMELSKILDNDEIIVLVGLSSKQLNQMPHNIIGITRTNDAHELADLYSSADVFINPTLEDNFPTTNIESLAAGTPVITFDTGGSAESIDFSTGSVLNDKELMSLYNEIIKYKHKKKKYTEKCVERARAFYDRADKFNEYIDLYKFLFERKYGK